MARRDTNLEIPSDLKITERQQQLSRLRFESEIKQLAAPESKKQFIPLREQGLELVKVMYEKEVEYFLIDHMSPIQHPGFEMIYEAYPVNVETGEVLVSTPYQVKKIPNSQLAPAKVQDECELHGKGKSFRIGVFDDYPISKVKRNPHQAVEEKLLCVLIFTETNRSLRKKRLFDVDFRTSMLKLTDNKQFEFMSEASADLVKIDGRFFVIDYLSPIGSGGYGLVYKSYLVDASTQKPTGQLYIAKIILEGTNTKELIDNEVEACGKDCAVYHGDFENYFLPKFINQQSHPGVKLERSPCYLLFTEYKPGRSLFIGDANKSLSAISRMDINVRFLAIDSLLEAVEKVHSSESGSAFIHSDLNGRNILLQKDGNVRGGGCKVSLIDYGLAKKLADNKSTIIIRNPMQFHAGAAPPEAFKMGKDHIIDKRSDTYALVGTIAIFLNCKNPFRSKERAIASTDRGSSLSRAARARFDVEDTLRDLHLSDFFTSLLGHYLNRMQEPNYEDRVFVSEARIFFQDCHAALIAYTSLEKVIYYTRMTNLILKAYDVRISPENKTSDFCSQFVPAYQKQHATFSREALISLLQHLEVSEESALPVVLPQTFPSLESSAPPFSLLQSSFPSSSGESTLSKEESVPPFSFVPRTTTNSSERQNMSLSSSPFSLVATGFQTSTNHVAPAPTEQNQSSGGTRTTSHSSIGGL